MAIIDGPLAWEWPEFASPAACAAAERAAPALARAAQLVLPDEAAAAIVRRRFGPGCPPLVVEPVPSDLAGVEATATPPATDIPYLVAPCPIEARSNALLLLQVWRDGLARALPLPRLILAGPRGDQIEEIAPLLDWNPGLKRQVSEAPGLEGPALHRLVLGARAILAPDFAAPPVALLRDARALGLSVLAAETPEAHALGLAPRLSPLDGPGWRAAILDAAAQRPAAPRVPPAPLLDWPSYAARLVARAEALS